jgi:hypothetical protein
VAELQAARPNRKWHLKNLFSGKEQHQAVGAGALDSTANNPKNEQPLLPSSFFSFFMFLVSY